MSDKHNDIKISGRRGNGLWVSSARRRHPVGVALASCGAPSSLCFWMVDEASRNQKVRDLHLGLALVGEVALEAPPAEIAPREW